MGKRTIPCMGQQKRGEGRSLEVGYSHPLIIEGKRGVSGSSQGGLVAGVYVRGLKKDSRRKPPKGKVPKYPHLSSPLAETVRGGGQKGKQSKQK